MRVDPVRLARQELAFNRWRAGKAIGDNPARPARGIIEAIPGFGKTYILILAIKYMNKKNPDWNAIVIVPSKKLYNDWIGIKDSPGHIDQHGLKNVQVFVVNTYVGYVKWKCDLLGLDECHHYANEDAVEFSKVLEITEFRFVLAMSATLEEKHKKFFETKGIPVVDTVDRIEGQRAGYVAKSRIYNLGIPLSTADKEFNEEINAKFRYYFAMFNHELGTVVACNGKKGVPVGVKLKDGKSLGKKTPEEWIKNIARIHNWDGTESHPYSPKNIARNAAQCMNIIQKRRVKWQNMPSKLEVAVQILNRFPLQIMVFSETAEFADKITARLPKIAVSYHTRLKTIAVKGAEVIEVTEGKMQSEDLKDQGFTIIGNAKRKSQALAKFLNPNDEVRICSTVRAMDEGVDVPGIAMSLIVAFNSTKRQGMQRGGRSERKDYNNLEKVAMTVYLYMIGTQEETWLKASQQGVSAHWIKSIDEINPQQTIVLGTNDSIEGNKEITIKPENIETGAVSSDANTTDQSSDTQ